MNNECNQFEKEASAYLDEELPILEIRPLFLHLADCAQCRAFVDSIRIVERRALLEGRIVPTSSLSARIESIRSEGSMRLDRRPDAPFAPRSIKREQMLARRLTPGGIRVSIVSLGVKSTLVALVGFILGVMHPWSYVLPSFTEPQMVYVSMLPDITVLGHVDELNMEGGSK